MATNEAHNNTHNQAAQNADHSFTNGGTNGYSNGNTGGATHQDVERITQGMTHEEKQAALQASRFGYGPLAHINTKDSTLLPAFGGEFQPGLYKGVKDRKFANPAPLGLSAFALTTFVLSLINMKTRNITSPNIVVALAYGYGGLIQLLAGMWEMAIGNTFGATALSSYGGFWLSFAIILTPGGFNIVDALGDEFNLSFSFYLFGWFIFTTILVLCTLKSTVAFFSLFFTLDLAFLMLALSYYYADSAANYGLTIAGGVFGVLAAFAAWYNALAGIADTSNSFFILPVVHLPWSAKGLERRGKADQHKV